LTVNNGDDNEDQSKKARYVSSGSPLNSNAFIKCLNTVSFSISLQDKAGPKMYYAARIVIGKPKETEDRFD
jgi:hypothetical protein